MGICRDINIGFVKQSTRTECWVLGRETRKRETGDRKVGTGSRDRAHSKGRLSFKLVSC